MRNNVTLFGYFVRTTALCAMSTNANVPVKSRHSTTAFMLSKNTNSAARHKYHVKKSIYSSPGYGGGAFRVKT